MLELLKVRQLDNSSILNPYFTSRDHLARIAAEQISRECPGLPTLYDLAQVVYNFRGSIAIE